MTDNDLRLRVARALGWSNFWYGDGIILADAPEATIEDDRSPLPNWPADWSAAGELLDLIVSEGANFSLINYQSSFRWNCEIFTNRRMRNANGETGPAAIAEAFCKWRELEAKG